MKQIWILGLLAMLAAATGCAAGGAAAEAPAVISGSEGGMYPPQDLSVVSRTGRVQFLNIYAEW